MTAVTSYKRFSLGPGSAVGGKGKKRGQIGKIRRYRRAKRVERWIARGKERHPFPSPDYLSDYQTTSRRAKRVERWIGEGERAPPFSLPRLPLGLPDYLSASEASRAVDWGGGKSATLFPPKTTSQLASLADFFFLFPPMRSLVPG